MPKKYGYICLNCGRTINYGVDKDGNCKQCSRGKKVPDKWFYFR